MNTRLSLVVAFFLYAAAIALMIITFPARRFSTRINEWTMYNADRIVYLTRRL